MPTLAKKALTKPAAPVLLREMSEAKLPTAQRGVAKATPPSKTIKAPKTGKASKPVAVKPVKPVKAEKADKVVRDGFSMPKSDYRLIGQLKERALSLGVEAKKSEVLRAGVKLLAGLDNGALLAALKSLEAVKTGRRKQ